MTKQQCLMHVHGLSNKYYWIPIAQDEMIKAGDGFQQNPGY